jgi:hypothetical protein
MHYTVKHCIWPFYIASTLVDDLTLQVSVEAHFDFLWSAIIKLAISALYLKVERQESKI